MLIHLYWLVSLLFVPSFGLTALTKSSNTIKPSWPHISGVPPLYPTGKPIYPSGTGKPTYFSSGSGVRLHSTHKPIRPSGSGVKHGYIPMGSVHSKPLPSVSLRSNKTASFPTGKPIYPSRTGKPTYFSSGSGTTLLSTRKPIYPSGSGVKISHVPTGSVYSRPFPSGSAYSNKTVSHPKTTLSTPPSATPSIFQLKVGNTGTSLDGESVYVHPDENGMDTLQFTADLSSASIFTLNPNATLQAADGELHTTTEFASIYAGDTFDLLMFHTAESIATGYTYSLCKIDAGALTCKTGTNVVFYTCLDNIVHTGPTITTDFCEGGFLLTLLVVPV
ncbi:hypothetical protein MMC28_006873 [Mycoblastus sanguinarius]|nr:hypothetical protein [Mycoblastus sanguinarius]